MFKRFLLVLLLILFSSNTFAEENNVTEPEKKEKDATKFEDIVVTATRTEKELQSAPGSVNVVTKKEMETRNITTIDDALNTTPGVFVNRQNLMDALPSITLNGIPGQNRTLIMMDGMPLNNAYDGMVSFTALPTENVGRVEVVQGPSSSLYGGYAMGGVVNMITQMPEKREFTVISGYGSSWHRGESLDDFQKYYVSYGDKLNNKISLLVSYGYKATNGYPKDLNVQSTQPPAGITGYSYTTDNGTSGGKTSYLIGDKGDNTWWDDSLSIKTRLDLTPDSKLSLSFMRTRLKYNYDDPHTYLSNASGQPVYSYGFVNQSSYVDGSGGEEVNKYYIKYETEIGNVKTKLTLGLNDYVKSWYVSPGYTSATTLNGGPGQVSSTPSQNYSADLQFTVPLFTRHVLTFGGSFKTDSANTSQYNLTNFTDETSNTALTYNSGGKDRAYAAFIQDEILILPNLTAYIGFREDWWETYDGYANQFGTGGFATTYDSRSDNYFSPKLAVVYKPFEVTTLKASAGQAFRGPTVYELYGTWQYYGITFASNPDLKPETDTSWDVAVVQVLWEGAKFTARYFDNYLKDLIYLETVSATLQKQINAGKAESKGITLELEQRFEKLLRLFANYTYTDARITENSAEPLSVGKRLTYLPDTMVNVGAECEIGPFMASVTGRYVGKRYGDDQNRDTINGVYTSMDPAFTADTKVSYKVTKFATLSFSVDNIFDNSYFNYYKAPGRSWFGGLEVKI